MSETDKILGIDQLRNLQFQVADLKTKLAEVIRQREEVDHWHLRQSLERLERAVAGHGTGDLKWEFDALKGDLVFEIDYIKSFVLHEETPET